MTDRLVFFGTDDFSVSALEALIDHGFNIVAVVTKPDAPVGRGRSITSPLVKAIADNRGIPVLQPAKLSDIAIDLKALHPDAGIVVAYGKIIPQSIIDLFAKGLINIHASLLPRYRGSSPIEAAILNGDPETGVSVMRITAGLDAGPIYSTAILPLSGRETKPQLFELLGRLGADTLIKILPDILDGRLTALAQNDDQAVAVKLIRKTDGQIDWNQPADIIDRQIRAYLGWPGSRTSLYGREVIITAAHPALPNEDVSRQLTHPTATASLVIDRLQPAGKREMTGREYLAGHNRG